MLLYSNKAREYYISYLRHEFVQYFFVATDILSRWDNFHYTAFVATDILSRWDNFHYTAFVAIDIADCSLELARCDQLETFRILYFIPTA